MWRGGRAVVTASGRTNEDAEHGGRRQTEGRRREEKTPSDQADSHHLRFLVLDLLKRIGDFVQHHLASHQTPECIETYPPASRSASCLFWE